MTGERIEHAPAFLPHDRLDDLVQCLRSQGYTVLGTLVRDGVTWLGPVSSAAELATGMRDRQDGGVYRLEEGEKGQYFQHALGPNGPKQYLFPPCQRLFSCHVEAGTLRMDEGPSPPPKLAMLGIRPCELAAIAVQDRVFGYGDPATLRCEADALYNQARKQAFLVVANCVHPGGTCFCASMGTGPKASVGFDLALTELRHGFVLEAGSEKGEVVSKSLPLRDATPAEVELAELKLQRAQEHMGRHLDTDQLPQLLTREIEHPHWDEVASRCLSCGNCTMVCPTCFCSTVTDTTDLSGAHATRHRQWESCFTHQFSYLTAGPVRHTIRGRYRHWMRHKLGTWHEQFECSGCVGCGRCITWCPVGIDITQEAAALRAATARSPAPPSSQPPAAAQQSQKGRLL